MANNIDRYILENGSTKGSVRRGFKWLVKRWKDGERDTIIAIDSKTIIDNIERELVNLIGEDSVKGLQSSDNYSQLNNQINIHTMTKRITPSNWSGGPVLAIYRSDELLSQIEELNDVTDILVIPWLEEDVESWRERHNPETIEFNPE